MRTRALLVAVSVFVFARCSGSSPSDLFDGGKSADATTVDAFDCAPQLTMCGAICVDAQTDPKNCGGCGVACPTAAACVAGKCVTCDQIDADKDGYDACVDCNDADPNVNPGAFDVPGNAVDDDSTARSTTSSPATRTSRATRRTRSISRTRWTCATRG